MYHLKLLLQLLLCRQPSPDKLGRPRKGRLVNYFNSNLYTMANNGNSSFVYPSMKTKIFVAGVNITLFLDPN